MIGLKLPSLAITSLYRRRANPHLQISKLRFAHRLAPRSCFAMTASGAVS
jgi:hypothetical protein